MQLRSNTILLEDNCFSVGVLIRGLQVHKPGSPQPDSDHSYWKGRCYALRNAFVSIPLSSKIHCVAEGPYVEAGQRYASSGGGLEEGVRDGYRDLLLH
jgi:hypothetical protein